MLRLLVLLVVSLVLAPRGLSAGDASDALSTEIARLQDAAFELFLERQQRLMQIHEPIRLANTELCEKKLAPVLGVFAASEDDLPYSLRDAAARRFGVDASVRVLIVMPGSAAAEGGLRVGDRVVEVGRRRASLGRTLMSRAAGRIGESLEVEVEREGEERVLQLRHRPGCFSAAQVVPSDFENAWVWEGQLYMTSAMIRLRSDDEIAIVMGHEIAHHVLGHPHSAQMYEADSDYLGLYLAARAGYDIAVGPELWRSMGRETPGGLEADKRRSHPTSQDRMLALQAAVDEIRAKQAAGQPLTPGTEGS